MTFTAQATRTRTSSGSFAAEYTGGSDVRFWAMVDYSAGPNECWTWSGQHVNGGYGRVSRLGKMHLAHRWAYEQLFAPIPAGMQLDHLCRNRGCVNPDHLEPVTPLENSRRGLKGALKTHCSNGHPYDEVNTHRYRGNRYCKTCQSWAWRHRAGAA